MITQLELTLIVAGKEIRNVFRNRTLLVGGLWFGCVFGLMGVSLGGQDISLDNKLYSLALMVGVLVGYHFPHLFSLGRSVRES